MLVLKKQGGGVAQQAKADPKAANAAAQQTKVDPKAPVVAIIADDGARKEALRSQPPAGCPATAGWRRATSAGKGWSAADALEAARSQENVEALHFIRLAGDYTSADKSQAYVNSVTRATKLTPAERSCLLVELSRMIEADQVKTLQLLAHPPRVSQHFADAK